MPRFSYIAVNEKDEVIKGKTELPDRASVINALSKQGLRPVSIRKLKDKKVQTKSSFEVFSQARVKDGNLAMFTRQLSAMIGAGVPLLRSLTSLEKYSEDRALKKILTQVAKEVEGGTPLGVALSKHPDTFDDIYVNMVKAGESAGILDEILKRIAAQQERSVSMKKKIRSAMTYPAILMGITVLAFFGLMIFVVPQIGDIVKGLGGPDAELPGITLAMLAISDFMITYWYAIIILIAVLIYALLAFVKTSRGKHMYHSLLLKLPAVKVITQKLAVARFSRTFSSLMGAGVAVLQAIDVTSRAVGNVIFEDALRGAMIEVQNGKSLSNVIGKDDLWPGIVSQMLAVGEETGQTDTVLIKVADFFEEEVDLAIDSVSSIIEPVMIIVMGSMVGVIAASVMLPIAQLSQNIQ